MNKMRVVIGILLNFIKLQISK
ncbi:hypothetical protein NB231_17605 [Nitrococcus mobilis Nb-231]|uniref:Uncharacterized protein n=1 Tax=Nitrococcus mobilis Nb-231 TaxID=314278 RepID=A4BVW8_9GAMM|nr:hypothetical protein NB231_17605 [Nitrococcus mobilis Nb-231]